MSLSRKAIDMIKDKSFEVKEFREYDTDLIKEIDSLVCGTSDKDFTLKLLDIFNLVLANKTSKVLESEINRYFKKVEEKDFRLFLDKINIVSNNISTGTLTELVVYLTVTSGIYKFDRYNKVKRLLDSILRFDNGLYLLIEDKVRADVKVESKVINFALVVQSFLGSFAEVRLVNSTFIIIDYLKRYDNKAVDSLYNLASSLVINMLCDKSRQVLGEDILDMLHTRQIQPGSDGLSIKGIEGLDNIIVVKKDDVMYISYYHNSVGNRVIKIVDGTGFSGVALQSDVQLIGEIILALECSNTDGYLARIGNMLVEQPDTTGSEYILTPINTVTADLISRGFRLIKRKQGASIKAKDTAEKCKFIIPEGHTISLLS